jgi:hypothetical protein
MSQPADAFARLRFAAWLSVGVHLVAGLAMAFVLRHGLETGEIPDRLVFLAQYKLAWQLGWLTWNLAALTILYFVICFARAHRDSENTDARLPYAVVVCAAAVPLDLAAEGIEMAVLPMLALDALGQTSVDPMRLFLAFQRTATMLTAFFANGLYSLATLLLVCATWRRYPVWIAGMGALVGLAGFGLSAAALLESVTWLVLTNIVLVPALLLWQSGVAIAAGRKAEVDHGPVRVG